MARYLVSFGLTFAVLYLGAAFITLTFPVDFSGWTEAGRGLAFGAYCFVAAMTYTYPGWGWR